MERSLKMLPRWLAKLSLLLVDTATSGRMKPPSEKLTPSHHELSSCACAEQVKTAAAANKPLLIKSCFLRNRLGFRFWLCIDAPPLATLSGAGHCRTPPDRKSGVEGKSVSVRVDLGGRRII